MKEEFDQLIKGTIHPFLKSNQFSKKRYNFTKSINDLVFIINFQKSRWNTYDETSFYINCAIHSIKIDNTIGKELNHQPKNYEAYYNRRIGSLTSNKTSGYVIDNNTNCTKLGLSVLSDVKEVLTFYATIHSTNDLINLMINENKLHHYEEIIHYLLLTDQKDKAQDYIQRLFQEFGQEKRWSIFQNTIDKIIQETK